MFAKRSHCYAFFVLLQQGLKNTVFVEICGKVCEKAGDKKAAKDNYIRSVTLDPGNREARAALEKLSR